MKERQTKSELCGKQTTVASSHPGPAVTCYLILCHFKINHSNKLLLQFTLPSPEGSYKSTQCGAESRWWPEVWGWGELS